MTAVCQQPMMLQQLAMAPRSYETSEEQLEELQSLLPFIDYNDSDLDVLTSYMYNATSGYTGSGLDGRSRDPMFGDDERSRCCWADEHPATWTCVDVLDWVYHVALEAGVDPYAISGENMRSVTGEMLVAMMAEDFRRLVGPFGDELYESFSGLLSKHDACPMLPGIGSFFDLRLPQPVTAFNSSETDSCGTNGASSDYLINSLNVCRSSLAIPPSGVMMDLDACINPMVAANPNMFFVNYREQQATPFQTSVPSSNSPTLRSSSSLFEPLQTGQPIVDDCGEDTWSLTGSPSSLSPSSSTDSGVGLDYCTFSDEWMEAYGLVPTATASSQLPKSIENVRQQPVTSTPKKPRKNSESSTSGVSTASSDVSSTTAKSVPMAMPGIQRRRREKSRTPHLWKFMRALLEDDTYNPQYIRWENRSDGVFRIVPGQSKHIAVLWGLKKNNPSMTFDKLSRSLRWCRKYGFLDDVPKNGRYPKKLCFRFAQFALEWNPDASISIPPMPAR